MFLLQPPVTLAPGQMPSVQQPQQTEQPKEDAISRFLSAQNSQTTKPDSFEPDLIEQFKSFLREGISPDTKTVKDFLAENNLTNDPKIKEILEGRNKDLKKLNQYILDGLESSHPLIQKLLSNSALSQREIKHVINTATIQRETGELFSQKSIGLHVAALNPLGLMLGGALVTTIHDAPRGWNIFTSTLSEGWSLLTD